jgi:hypothetical protein
MAPQVLTKLKIKDHKDVMDALSTKIWASPLKGEISSQELSNWLASAFVGLTDAHLTLNEYRHLAIILMRKLIKHHGLQEDQMQQFVAIMDLQAGHTHQTSEDHYGLLTDQMAVDMTDNDLALYVGVSEAPQESRYATEKFSPDKSGMAADE